LRRLKRQHERGRHAEFTPNVDIEAAFRALSRGEMPDGSNEWDRRTTVIDAHGRFDASHAERAPVHLLPTASKPFIAETEQTLRNATVRAFGVLRWRIGEIGSMHGPTRIAGAR
jgi:hypothetical protein